MAGRPKGSTNAFPSDVQRERLYVAEREIDTFHYLDFGSLDEVNRYLQRFIKRKAWTKKTPVRVITLTAYNRVYAEGRRIGMRGEVDLPPWAWSKLIVAHELAHIMTPPLYGKRAIHSREFAGTYIYLAGKICGKEVRDDLVQAFFRHNIDWDGAYAS